MIGFSGALLSVSVLARKCGCELVSFPFKGKAGMGMGVAIDGTHPLQRCALGLRPPPLEGEG
jgi:hypothetical protein